MPCRAMAAIETLDGLAGADQAHAARTAHSRPVSAVDKMPKLPSRYSNSSFQRHGTAQTVTLSTQTVNLSTAARRLVLVLVAAAPLRHSNTNPTRIPAAPAVRIPHTTLDDITSA